MTVATAEPAKLDVMARELDGVLYVFAVNFDERLVPAQATIRVAGLDAGSRVAVIDENRTLRAAAGSFNDVFEPLAVHIYRID